MLVDVVITGVKNKSKMDLKSPVKNLKSHIKPVILCSKVLFSVPLSASTI